MQHVGTEVVARSCKPSLPQLLLEGQQEVDRSQGRRGGEEVFSPNIEVALSKVGEEVRREAMRQVERTNWLSRQVGLTL